MDLTLSSDQRDLQLGLRGLLADLWSDDRLRAAAADVDLDSKAWLQLADVGVFGACAPEEADGMGLGVADAAVLFEELGAALVPGPLVATVVTAALAPEHVALDGTAVVTVLDLRARGVRLVEHWGTATQVLLIDGDGLRLAPRSAIPAEPVARPLDPLTPVWRVPGDINLGDVGCRVGDSSVAEEWIRRATVLIAALQVGVARGALDRAVRYAQERSQFDRLIGSFQAVKHLLAESLVRVDVARAAVLVAALCVDDADAGERDEEVAAAKLLADEAATLNGRCGIQVHGGMGFTWEVLAHLYLKRAWLQETSFGTADEHAARLAAAF